MTTTLTLGPLMFNWTPERWRDFYARIADEAPVERVCIGEVVCSKRLPFIVDLFAAAAERLQRAGKTVLLSSLALPTLLRERRQVAELLAVPGVLIEINDLSAVSQLAGQPFAVSPLINVYNEGTLAFLKSCGAVHACLPPELPLTAIAALAPLADGVTLEVWAFGRLPLAISARCYHARIQGLAKDFLPVRLQPGPGRTAGRHARRRAFPRRQRRADHELHLRRSPRRHRRAVACRHPLVAPVAAFLRHGRRRADLQGYGGGALRTR